MRRTRTKTWSKEDWAGVLYFSLPPSFSSTSPKRNILCSSSYLVDDSQMCLFPFLDFG